MAKIKYTFHGEAFVFYGGTPMRWSASTYASSKARAISNLKYRFRHEMGYSDATPVDFSGIIESGGERYEI